MDRDNQFQRIKQYFDNKDRELAAKGRLPLGSTEKGFWGVAHLDDCYELFKRIHLEKETAIIDLGSGDGRVVLVASLFTQATGVEYDAKLHSEALQAMSALGLQATFLCTDYTALDLSVFPIWFSYADHNFRWIEEKKHELTHLYLYHDTFHPENLYKEKIEWIGQIPVFHYTKTTRQE